MMKDLNVGKKVFFWLIMKNIYLHRILLILFLFLTCIDILDAQNQKLISPEYIFIGHCYQDGAGGSKVDYRLEAFDFSDFEGVWLGGDVCSEALLNFSTILYIDSIFDLENPETHWALGNHDARNGNWEWYQEVTGRNTDYVYSNNGITRIIMNTNLVPTDCESMNAQYERIITTCDTVQPGNNLILIMHHGIWNDVPGLPPPGVYGQSDLKYWNSNCFTMKSTFVESVYPKLLEANSRGVHIYCLIGDMGAGPKYIDYLNEDGIHFLGCGFHHNEPDDRVLIFTLETSTKQLQYEYHRIDSLLSAKIIGQ